MAIFGTSSQRLVGTYTTPNYTSYIPETSRTAATTTTPTMAGSSRPATSPLHGTDWRCRVTVAAARQRSDTSS